jgi:hydrogenase maturation protein HypF
MSTEQGIKRYSIDVSGTVQGVGFRPFVYRLARRCCLTGFVRNTTLGVELEVEGPGEQLDVFTHDIIEEKPEASQISDFNLTEIVPLGDSDFIIKDSSRSSNRAIVIPPDIATCGECLEELFDAADRRHHYPFTNCTNCGPRYTIVNPSHRRFHAQPNACRDCGPALTLLDESGREIQTDDPVREAVNLLSQGSIVAVKSLGGFHLAVDATRNDPVTRLRERKGREEKPFAIMSGDVESVRTYSHVGPDEERLLTHTARPILLLEKKNGSVIAEEVAPGNRYLGVMLPYTPTHHLLFESSRAPLALVLTSANEKEEPIAKDNRDTLTRLEGITDYFLVHNRDIFQRADDSVMRVIGGKPYMMRRSRGWVPSPVRLNNEMHEILGCGAHLKNTVCITRGSNAHLSQHIGDLESVLAHEFYEETIEHMEKILGCSPRIVAHDLHPDYLSTRYAEEREAEHRIAVQHHHAHIASCLAENGESGPVIGLSCDGTGLGDDGTIWGGEILLADLSGYERIGHLETFPLPGGDSAVKEPWRAAFSLMRKSLDGDHMSVFAKLFPEIPPETTDLLQSMLDQQINSPLTSSLGRLFDTVSAILGISRRPTFEGQAAMSLEMAITGSGGRACNFEIISEGSKIMIGTDAIIRHIVRDVTSGVSPGEVSRKFHDAIVEALHLATYILSGTTETKTVVLSGGCFQNVYLLEKLSQKLEGSGFKVLKHSIVPPNDGGIALGQVVIADSILKEDKTA